MTEVRVDKQGAVAIIRVDNPPVNALSHAVRDGLRLAIDEVENDSTVNAAVLICEDRTFIAGADIREFGQPPKEPQLPEVIAHIEGCNKPLVAAIHGTALGGGLEVAMACHYRIATTDAKLGLPEVKLGLLPGSGGTQRLPRLVGIERALKMITSGNPIGARSAESMGLVDRIAESGLESAAIEFATEVDTLRRTSELSVDPVADGFFDKFRKSIARRTRGQNAPERIVRCVEATLNGSFEEGTKLERQLFVACRDSTQSTAMRHLFFAEREVAKIPDVPRETPRRDIQTIAVIGAGTMGAGIALACLNAGLNVALMDRDRAGVERGQAMIQKLLVGMVSKGRITQDDMDARLTKLALVTEYETIAQSDLIIEAVFETMAIKRDVFENLDRVCRDGAILATNTSTLDIDAIANATKRPEDVIGLHFFSPANIMKLLEIVRGARTSPEVIASSMRFAKTLGKIGVLVGNCFGFVGNRMLYGYGRENQLLLLEGAAPEFIDKTLYDWGMAMGPNAVGDLAGLDVGFKVRQERTDLPDDPRYYRVADILAEQGCFGQKTGKGMYLYPDGSRKPEPDPEVAAMIEAEAKRLGVAQRDIEPDEIIDRCICALIVEGAKILDEGIALRSGDIDVVWANGYGFPRYRGGPMCYADTVGADKIYETVCRLRDIHGEQYWSPPRLLEQLASSGERFADWSPGTRTEK